MNSSPPPEALRAIRAWYALSRATSELGRHLGEIYGVTGDGIAILRIVAEQPSWHLGDLQQRLVMQQQPTLNQLLDRLATRGLIELSLTPDRWSERVAAITATGNELLSAVPLAGPVRLGRVEAEPEQLTQLALAFENAIGLFGLEEWVS